VPRVRKKKQVWLPVLPFHHIHRPGVRCHQCRRPQRVRPNAQDKEKLISFFGVIEELATHPKLQHSSSSSERGATQQAVNDICQGMDLLSSALLWHVVSGDRRHMFGV
jgi:hypothetical protein